MAHGYIPVDRDQQFLVPPDMREWLPENHLVWWLLEVVDRLDTGALHSRRRRGGQGRAGYDPDMLLALLVYAYCTKVRSSRQIERLCETDVAFRVICANRVPDHTTIARFRQDHAEAARGLFREVLELCAHAGLAQVGVVALDGTKIAADASRALNRDREWLEAEIASMFEEAAVTDSDEDDRYGPGRGDGLPEDLADPSARRARLEAALSELGSRSTNSEEQVEVWESHLEAAQDRLVRAREVWKRTQETKNPSKPGCRPKYPEGCRVARIQQRIQDLEAKIARLRDAQRPARVNLTDPDSRLMVSKDGWVQGYNAQAAVNHIGVICAAEVYNNPNDTNLYTPMIDTLAENAEITGPAGIVLADAGYCTNNNLTAPGPTRLIATAKAHKLRNDPTATSGPPPPEATPLQAMTHTLRTPEGRSLYKQRSTTIEPGFGNIKTNLGFTRFSRRGLKAAQGEWHLVTAAANLLKLHRYHPQAIYAT